MTLALDSRAVMDRFDALCRLISLRGQGMTMSQLGSCHALARELEADGPDPERVRELARRLDIDVEDLRESVSE